MSNFENTQNSPDKYAEHMTVIMIHYDRLGTGGLG
jgi:hypothetical protein